MNGELDIEPEPVAYYSRVGDLHTWTRGNQTIMRTAFYGKIALLVQSDGFCLIVQVGVLIDLNCNKR